MTTKQVIVIRKDLNMRRGKECAQAGHASMEWLRQLIVGDHMQVSSRYQWSTILLSPVEQNWLAGDRTKICLQVDSEEKLNEIDKLAEEADVKSFKITDLGKTEFDGKPTVTCLAIGPDLTEKIDTITRGLKLY